jgi:xanthine dehydrogenase YagS FAD-binding subunit
VEYERARSVADALQVHTRNPDTRYLAGGTNLVDLMKYEVEQPQHLIDISHLPLTRIDDLPGGGVRIGALVRNSDLAAHPRIARDFPVLSEALLNGASAQLRNMATTGGNLLQRTRCYYFYDVALPCNKRVPGSGCGAIAGQNRIHAILGQSDACIAVHPSDMAVAMAALDAIVQVQGPRGPRTIPLLEFHRLPGNTPQIDTNLEPGELIVAVDLPGSSVASRSHYLKVRDRASYAFALVSAAVAFDTSGGAIRNARLALGGVAHKPWRALDAERALIGGPADEGAFRKAAEIALQGAKGYEHNSFKVELAKRTIVRAYIELAESPTARSGT